MKKIVIFDGVCNLCNASVDFILRHDRREVFVFASNSSDAGRSLLEQHGVDPREVQSIYLAEDGRISSKSTAVLRIARDLGFPWSLATVFRLVPRPLRDLAYDLVAKTRYRVFGRKETCRLPRPGERERFLDHQEESDAPPSSAVPTDGQGSEPNESVTEARSSYPDASGKR